MRDQLLPAIAAELFTFLVTAFQFFDGIIQTEAALTQNHQEMKNQICSLAGDSFIAFAHGGQGQLDGFLTDFLGTGCDAAIGQ